MESRTNDSLPDAVLENGEGTVDAEGRSRRDILRGLAAAAAGAMAGGVLSTEKAEAGHGTQNAISSSSNPAIHGENTGDGPGVEGTNIGTNAPDPGPGVRGFSRTGVGVQGLGNVGVRGLGLIGLQTDIGVDGFGTIGVRAVGSSAALQVQGMAQFTTVGSGVIGANQDSVFVESSFVRPVSHVTVTLTGDPGQAGSAPGFKPVVVWVERQPGTGFVVHMSRPVRVATPFTYFVVEPAP
jgi:hypothetical protein